MSTILSSTFCRRVTLSRSPTKHLVIPYSPKYRHIARPSLPLSSRRNSVKNYSATSSPKKASPEQDMARSKGDSSQKKEVAVPRPSSSVILVSPQNEILLLHRVQTSSSFASAHVFPGGNLSNQDGPCPPPEDPTRHDDAPHYRNAAIRELFEESGILLAKDANSGKMLFVDEATREQGRKLIHQNKITFDEWLKQQHSAAVPDIDQLIPFSRWVTPTNVPKRYTTQMYLYFMPLPVDAGKELLEELPVDGKREEIQVPTSDGGIEVTEAQFLPASEWLRRAQSGEIILFPPQFLLLHIVSGFLDQGSGSDVSVAEMEKFRAALVDFVHSGSPPWTHKCISPKMLKMTEDGKSVLALDHPGPELKGTDRLGEPDRVVVLKFLKGSAREVTVAWKKDVFQEKKEGRSNL